MAQLVIQGNASLSGSIPVYGSKNAALPLICAALLTRETVTLHNIPPISDVERMVEIIQAAGVTAEHTDSTLTISAKDVSAKAIPQELVGKLRGSILLLGALLARCGEVELSLPGGDIIGARPIDTHIDGLEQLGAVVTEKDDRLHIQGDTLSAGEVVLREFSVTATENILLVAASLPGTTTIYTAAAEPHVVALAELLSSMGATISGAGTHQIVVEGSAELSASEYTNIPDMLEAGFFTLMGIATNSEITVTGAPSDDLRLFFKKLHDMGAGFEISDADNGLIDVTTKPGSLQAFKLQALPHPGIASDLQAPFAVLATQASGSSLIHDPLYEGRFKHIAELQKMGADVVVADPHRVIINGPTPLHGREIPSLDIRAGATLVLAGLVAQGTTVIHEAEIIDRGYANLTDRLAAIGADISRTE